MNTRRPQDGPAALVSRLRDELNALEVRAAVAEQRHRELLEATEDLRAACSQAEGRADEYLRQAAASDGALQEREARLAALDEERAHTRAELTELRAHLLRTTSELGAAQGGLKLSAEVRADLQARLAGLDEERTRIRSELGAAQAGLRLSEEAQADLRARLDAARGEAEQLARTLREATAERRDWEAELSRLRRELEQARAHQEAELAKARGESEARRLEQQALLTRAQQEHQAEIARVRQQAGALEQTIAGLQAALKAQEADLQRLQRIVGRARDYVELIERSERWRLGGMLTRLGGRLLRRKAKPDAVVQLLRLLPTRGSMAPRPAAAPAPLPRVRSVPPPGAAVSARAKPLAVPPGPPAPILRPLEQMPGTAAPPTMPEGVSADVVVCVHDALADARACLESVIARTDHGYSLIVVDDGSGPETASFLHAFAEQHEHIRLIRNQSALGYTCAANQGLRASQADWVILLNSDTIVTTGWLARLLECGESDPKTGIVGPVSNSATWQSVPKLIEDGTWADNPLPYWTTVEDMGKLVAQCSDRKFPEFPLPSGFCLAVRRAVIERIGYFDEEKYPRGYGEENDYAFRAAKAGFTLRLADHCYVYHAGSRSFTPEGRLDLIHQNRPALVADWGEAIARAQDQIKEDDSLDGLRRRVGEWAYQIGLARSGPSLSILFLLPGISEGTSGGAHMIVDLVCALRALGIQANVAIERQCRDLFFETYPASRDSFLIYRNEQELISETSVFDVLVVTHFRTAQLAQRLRIRREQLIAYYVQDYEPWIALDDEERGLAAESYTLIPDAVPFAMTNWIINTVREETGVAVHKVEPAFHQGIFSKSARRDDGPVTVCAMVRPRTPRRAAERTLRVLKRLRGHFGSRIRIIIFGCDPRHPILSSEAAQFEFECAGILSRDRAAALMCQSDIFIDASDYQAYGLTAVEAMSCGCVAVVPLRGGARSYAQNGLNAVIVDTQSEDAVVAGASKLISEDEFRRRLARNGRRTADEMSLRRLALSTYLMLAEERAGRGQGAPEPPIAAAPLRRTSEPEAEARYLDELQRLPAERPAVLFLLPDVSPGGGSHSVSHAAAHMRAFGLPAAVAVAQSERPSVEAHYGDIADTFLFYQDRADLDAQAQDFAIIVATLFTTVPTAIHLAGSGTRGMAAYYVQDYEPYFLDYPPADPVGDPRTRALRAAAVASYTLDPSAVLFAKTDWLCREVERETGAQVDRVEAGIDLDMFGPGQSQSGPVNVCAMIRPYSGYRAPELTMRLLKRLKQCFGDAVHPIVFGCDPEDPAFLTYERDFDHENVGVVGREGVAGVFARSHVFIDASAWQGFGRTGVEAMAAGCVPVVPLRGGGVDYAVDGENSLVVDTRDENAIFRAASRLITDQSYRQQLACNGLQTARRYTMGKNALSIYVLLARRYWERFGEG